MPWHFIIKAKKRQLIEIGHHLMPEYTVEAIDFKNQA